MKLDNYNNIDAIIHLAALSNPKESFQNPKKYYDVNLKKTKAEGQSPWVLITSAWGFSVFVGAYVAGKYSGAHLNPAVTIGLATAGKFTWKMVLQYILSPHSKYFGF